MHIVCPTAHLHGTVLPGIDLAHMEMGIGNRLTGFHISYHNTADILSQFIHLLHLKTGIEQLLLQFLGCYIYLYIFF